MTAMILIRVFSIFKASEPVCVCLLVSYSGLKIFIGDPACASRGRLGSVLCITATSH